MSKKEERIALRQIIGTSPTSEDIEVLVRSFSYLTTYGAEEIKDEINIKAGIPAGEPLSSECAARELGFTGVDPATELRNLVNKHLGPGVLKQTKDAIKEDRRSYLRDLSEGIIEQGLTGELELSDEKRVDSAFRLLEKTDKAYNPKVEVETTTNIEMSYEEALEQIKEIAGEDNNILAITDDTTN